MDTTSSNPVTNTSPATESICPKGWTLPSNTQIHTIGNNTSTYVSNFSPVLGGRYYSSALNDEDNRGFWWSSEASNNARRYRLNYNGNTLYSSSDGTRLGGFYIRCINKQKTVLDLTYMQEMTPAAILQIAKQFAIIKNKVRTCA